MINIGLWEIMTVLTGVLIVAVASYFIPKHMDTENTRRMDFKNNRMLIP